MSPRFSFARKAACATLLVAVADGLFYGHEPGWTLGAFAIAWVAGLLAAVPGTRRRWPAVALAVAALLGAVLVDDPNPLAWALFWTAVASAAVLPRHRFDDALRWSVRLASYALAGPFRPLVDMGRLVRRRMPGGAITVAGTLALPVAGSLVFGALFAVANPLIGNAVGKIELPSLWSAVFHGIFWCAVLAVVWPSLRPWSVRLDRLPARAVAIPSLPITTLRLSLLAFNALFALQNALDIAFLWSGAPLPAGVTLAEYAHRGAYTLIATALLAGAFVLIAFAPGSPAARSAAIRRLVVVWVAQNVLLVASSMLRLLDYIGAYSLTELRISALAWMVLVAIGLVLVAMRLTEGRTTAWLINANAAAATIVLLLASVVDLGAVAASWNVRHAQRGDELDLCYLNELNASALLPLIELERRAGGPVLRDRARHLRIEAMTSLVGEQADWHSWTWRNARRLAAARRLTADMPIALRAAPHGRRCDGGITPPPPLTGEARP